MKKIIRWIAEVTGVAKQIRKEAYEQVGHRMQQYSYWFLNGQEEYDISNVLFEYANKCLHHGMPHLFGTQHDELRNELRKLHKEGKSILVENNKKNGKKRRIR